MIMHTLVIAEQSRRTGSTVHYRPRFIGDQHASGLGMS